MRTQSIILTVVAGAGAACLASLPLQDDKGPPVFRHQGYQLACNELESRSKIDLTERGEKQHTLSVKGALTVPQREDVVAVTEQLKVIETLDARLENLILKSPTKRAGKTKRDFMPVIDGKADVEIKKIALTGNAYRINSMKVEAEAVVARRRENKRLPAVVMRDLEQFVPGLSVRIETLKLSSKRELTVVVRYTRSSDTTAGPFLEQMWALDADGMKLAGGRWTKGDPFDDSGTLKGELQLPGDAAAKYIRLVAVTEHEKKTVPFEIRGIFQQ